MLFIANIKNTPENLLIDLMNKFPDPFLTTSQQGEIVAFNPPFAQLMGCEGEELAALLEEQSLPSMIARTHPAGDYFHRLEAEVKNGEGRTAHLVLRVYRSDCGQYFYAFVNTAREEKEAEEAFNQAATYRLIAENAAELIAVVNARTLEVCYANPAYLKAQQDIEQGGFAHIGTPDDHNLQTLIQDARRALIAGAEQTLSQLADPGQQVSRRFLL